jgi:mannose-6-phosphate isomerase
VVSLQPGEALFQPAGVLHAYVEGMGVELMANSDNVLRGGLTKKYVNVGELLRVLSFAPRPADVLHGKDVGRYVSRYDTPIDEFELLRIRIDRKDTVLRSRRSSVEMGICTAGEFTLRSSRGDAAAATLKVSRGESFLVPYAWGDYTLEGSGMIYIAEIPDKKG